MIDQFTYFMENEDEIDLSNKTINEARLDELENCIGELKDEQRICIELFYLKKMRYKEMEVETGFSFKEIKSHIQNGKRKLGILLSKDGQK